jgi:hypothetical protein
MDILPLCGTDNPDLFAIEAAAMDRDERVVVRLDELLPEASVADIDAENVGHHDREVTLRPEERRSQPTGRQPVGSAAMTRSMCSNQTDAPR